jgi:hypothetical protein
MKNLNGRVVGYKLPYREGGDRRTVWARVTAEHRYEPNLLIAENIHTGVAGLVHRDTIHTVMSETY